MVNSGLIVNLLIFIVSAIVLSKSGTLIVRSLVKIAISLKLGEFVIGFLLMSLFTSMPELFISITSSIKHDSELALGTAVGSNIADLTLIIGLAVLVGRGIKVSSESIKKNMKIMILIATIPVILMVIGKSLSRIDGIILLAVFALYLISLFKERWFYVNQIDEDQRKHIHSNIKYNLSKNLRISFNNYLVFLLCIGLLFGSAWTLTTSAKQLSIDLGFPEILVGLIIVAIGTSLPELTFQTKSILEKHENMALGNVFGSVVNNSTLVLGIGALINPIQTNLILFFTSALFMLLFAFLFMALITSKHGINWKDAMTLIIIYIFYVIIELGLKTFYNIQP